jgi:hypothetical protein
MFKLLKTLLSMLKYAVRNRHNGRPVRPVSGVAYYFGLILNKLFGTNYVYFNPHRH